MSSKIPLALTGLMLAGCGVEQDQDGCPTDTRKDIVFPITGNDRIKEVSMSLFSGRGGSGEGAYRNDDWRKDHAGKPDPEGFFPGCEVGIYGLWPEQTQLMSNYPPERASEFMNEAVDVNSVAELSQLMVEELLNVNKTGIPVFRSEHGQTTPYIALPERQFAYQHGYPHPYSVNWNGTYDGRPEQSGSIKVVKRTRSAFYRSELGLVVSDSIQCSHDAVASHCTGTYILNQWDSNGDFAPDVTVWTYDTSSRDSWSREGQVCKPPVKDESDVKPEVRGGKIEVEAGVFDGLTGEVALQDMHDMEGWLYTDFNYDLARDVKLCERLVNESRGDMTWVQKEDLEKQCDVSTLTFANYEEGINQLLVGIEGALNIDPTEEAAGGKAAAERFWSTFEAANTAEKEAQAAALLAELEGTPLGDEAKLKAKGAQINLILAQLKEVAEALPEDVQINKADLTKKALVELFSASPISCGDPENLAYNLSGKGRFSTEASPQKERQFTYTPSLDTLTLDFSDPKKARDSIEALMKFKAEVSGLLATRQVSFKADTAGLLD